MVALHRLLLLSTSYKSYGIHFGRRHVRVQNPSQHIGWRDRLGKHSDLCCALQRGRPACEPRRSKCNTRKLSQPVADSCLQLIESVGTAFFRMLLKMKTMGGYRCYFAGSRRRTVSLQRDSRPTAVSSRGLFGVPLHQSTHPLGKTAEQTQHPGTATLPRCWEGLQKSLDSKRKKKRTQDASLTVEPTVPHLFSKKTQKQNPVAMGNGNYIPRHWEGLQVSRFQKKSDRNRTQEASSAIKPFAFPPHSTYLKEKNMYFEVHNNS
ncbi:unnamed protein product [Ectocarpus sp. 13 AM-2016]